MYIYIYTHRRQVGFVSSTVGLTAAQDAKEMERFLTCASRRHDSFESQAYCQNLILLLLAHPGSKSPIQGVPDCEPCLIAVIFLNQAPTVGLG